MRIYTELQELVQTIVSSLNEIKHYKQMPVIDRDGKDDLVNKALRNHRESFRSLAGSANAADALAICENPTLFSQLNEEAQTLLASVQPVVFESMLKSGKLATLHANLLSTLVMGYAINVGMLYRGTGMLLTRGIEKHCVINPIVRAKICLAAAKDPAIISKINPAAKILLFASIKNAGLYLDNSLTPEVKAAIDAAFNIQVDYNPEVKPWDCCLWPAMAGDYGSGDYIARRHELMANALGGQVHKFPDESRASAQVLIELPELSIKMSEHFKIQRSNDHVTKERFLLAAKHPHVAQLILNNPSLRGIPGEITDEDIDYIAGKHRLPNPRVAELKAKNAALELENEALRKRLRELENMQNRAPGNNLTSVIVQTSGGRYQSPPSQNGSISDTRHISPAFIT